MNNILAAITQESKKLKKENPNLDFSNFDKRLNELETYVKKLKEERDKLSSELSWIKYPESMGR